MEQPKGTVTYKGHRKTTAGQESFCKNKEVLNSSGKLHSDGKATEEAAKLKKAATTTTTATTKAAATSTTETTK